MNNNYKSANLNIITNWGNILLDTTFIIRVINYAKNKKEVNKLCFELMEFLAETKYQETPSKSNDRQFFVSTISIAEILVRYEDSVEKSKIMEDKKQEQLKSLLKEAFDAGYNLGLDHWEHPDFEEWYKTKGEIRNFQEKVCECKTRILSNGNIRLIIC